MSSEFVHFTILGELCSLKNSRKIAVNRKTGRMFPLRNPAIERFSENFAAQVPPDYRGLALSGPVAVTVDVWYPDRRKDLDVALVHDLLQQTGVIEDDRQIVEQHNYRHLDRENPRVSIIVRELE